MYDEDGVGGLSREFSSSSGQTPPPRGRTRPKRKRPVKDRSAAIQKPEPGNWAGAPKGYDSDIWHLAKGFQQGSEWAGVTPREGVPVIYNEIKSRLDGDKKIADTPNLEKQRIKLVELMIEYFWNNWNLWLNNDDLQRGLHEFTSLQTWNDLRDTVVQRAYMKHVAKTKTTKPRPPKAERPKRVRQPEPPPREYTEEELAERVKQLREPGAGLARAKEILRRRADERSASTDHEDR